MKFPIEWLLEVLPVKTKNAEMARVLTNIGLEVEYFDNDIIDVSIPANRADCASIFGVVRELTAALQQNLVLPELTAIEPDHEMSLHIKIDQVAKCPRYISRIIANVNAAAKTPDFIQQRLTKAGFKSISVIVDLTNYVMLETGQPLHAFDLSKIVGKLVVRNAFQGEQLELLDDSKVSLCQDDLVIADDLKALALAGVMGCKNSAISAETTKIALEAAYFAPTTIRTTAKRVKLQTEASFRFERGICAHMQSDALKRLTSLILQYAGGNPSITNHFKDTSYLPVPSVIILHGARVASVLGHYFENNEIIEILARLGFTCELISPREISVTVPSFRVDVTQEIDLIEEIVRLYGLNQIIPKPPKISLEFKKHPDALVDLHTIKRMLMAQGYNETINYSFISPSLHEVFFPSLAKIELINPISLDLSIMRSSLIPGLLKVLQYNQNRQIRANLSLRIFEAGIKFVKIQDKILQTPVIAGATYGRLFPKNWADSNQQLDFFDLKQDVVNIFKLGNLAEHLEFKPVSDVQGMHPSQTALILNKGLKVGIIGALHPSVANSLELKSEIFCFEIDLDALQKAEARFFQDFSKYPSISRDIAMLVASALPAVKIKSFIKDFCGVLLKDIIIFDVFAGAGVPDGKKSLAVSLIFQDQQQTLNVEVVNDLFQKLIESLQTNLDVELRQ